LAAAIIKKRVIWPADPEANGCVHGVDGPPLALKISAIH
jgi:hypothetical protein